VRVKLGENVGMTVGFVEGSEVEGTAVGNSVGVEEGELLGAEVVGPLVRSAVGIKDGIAVGYEVGDIGLFVTVVVGS
jgi:hypothetical protein